MPQRYTLISMSLAGNHWFKPLTGSQMVKQMALALCEITALWIVFGMNS